jgi:hypothetical protein
MPSGAGPEGGIGFGIVGAKTEAVGAGDGVHAAESADLGGLERVV